MDKPAVPAQSCRIMIPKQMIDSPISPARWIMVLVAALLAGCASMNRQLCKAPVGLQLYSVRAQMGKDVPGTLEEVHNWGIKYVELAGTYKLTPAEFKMQLDAHGLVAIGGHFPYDKWQDDPESALKEADALGLKYVGCAWIPHQGMFDEVVCRQAIAVFNKAGELAAKHHMRFFYHTHGYEFRPFDNGTLMDLLIRETNPDQVKFEMDIFWVAHAGQDPAQWLEKYPAAGR